MESIMKYKCTIEIEFDDQEMIDARDRLDRRRKWEKAQQTVYT